MKVFAISDLHLSFMVEKPMDVFGGAWENYTDKIKENWNKVVGTEDLVLIAGDISWAMKLEETKLDFDFIDKLNGQKIIIRGNHEYWWKSISGVRDVLPSSIKALQNDSIRVGEYIIAGTRGWLVPEGDIDNNYSKEDRKVYDRENIRLELALTHMSKQRKKGDKVICMIHFPPFNSHEKDSGFTELFEKYNVDKVVYGHIHTSAGRYKKITIKNGVEYYLTSADLIDMKPVLLFD